ncbi:phage tail protein [Pasteurellaceae bacterium LFhippo2]|nr:phage tail protein [Pasteurellaceae bacterium LFhippo2]
MILNEQIRQEITEVLRREVQRIKYFHSGRIAFTDLDQELPAIAVFIDEVYADEYTNCDDEFDAFVKVGIYLPLGAREDQLDLVAEEVSHALRRADLETVAECQLKRYTYDYDPNESAWVTSTLHYQVKFYN